MTATTSTLAGSGPDSQSSLLTDTEIEAIRPGVTRAWNPAAARDYLTGLGGEGMARCSPCPRPGRPAQGQNARSPA